MSEAENNNDNGQEIALTPVRQAQGMVLSYATKLLNDEKAKQFATQLAVMSKRDPKIAACTPESLATAIIACVHLDLMPNTPEGYAFVIPYKNRKMNRYEAQFQVGYKGMVQLAYRSGKISGINAELVFPTDEFEVDFATRKMHHKPDLSRDRTVYKDAIAAYAVASLPNGGIVFDVMSRSEIEKVKGTVKAKSTDAPWETWEESMVKKTTVKRLTKVLPQSTKDKMQLAAAYDSWAEAGKLGMVNGEIVEDKVIVPNRSPEEEAAISKEAAEIANKIKKSEDENEGTSEPKAE